MTKLFLVEDESIMRNGIKNQINWEREGIEFVGEAGDGELAWPMILETKPDILLTDIKMPFMDGLQLSELVRKELPDTYIIILSGYDEFAYAQKAISLGVTEYLLKPLPPGKLLESIRKVQKKIDEDRSSRDMDWNEELEREKNDFYRQKLFRALVMNNRSPGEAIELAQKLGLNITARYYLMLLMNFLDNDGKRPERSLLNELENAAKESDGFFVFDRGEDGYAILASASEEDELIRKSETMTERIVSEVSADSDLTYYIAVGRPVNRISDIGNSFTDANRAFSYRFIAGRNKVVKADQIRSGSAVADGGTIDVEGAVTGENSRQVIGDFMRTGTYEEAEPFIEGVFDSVGEKNLGSMIFLNYFVMDMYFAMARFAKQADISTDKIDEKCGSVASFISSGIDPEKSKSYLGSWLRELIRLRNRGAEKKYSRMLRDAVRYIDENYAKEDISLNRVAGEVNMSPNHFSTVFSQEMGITFIEYLIQKRMDEAKRLLRTTPLRSSEIAYRVGYKDPHYFSATFKKTQGMTPREYRAGNAEHAGD